MEEKILELLEQTALFRGMRREEIYAALEWLGAARRTYRKGAVIYHAGDHARTAGVVLSGSVCIENHDVWGNKSILDRVAAGQVFAESYACVPQEPMMVDVVASEAAEVLFLYTERLLQGETHPALNRMLGNFLRISAQKNLQLSRKIFYISSKSIRSRLQLYLSDQATRLGTREFDIPFDRQQLADYLGVDRSALSHALSMMQREGLLTVRKNHFCLQEDG